MVRATRVLPANLKRHYCLPWRDHGHGGQQNEGMRLTNPGDQPREADQRAGVRWAASDSLRRFMPGKTSMR